MEWIISLITRIRSLKADYSIPVTKKVDLTIHDADDATLALIDEFGESISRMAGVNLRYVG